MSRKSTYAELEQRIQELEKALAAEQRFADEPPRNNGKKMVLSDIIDVPAVQSMMDDFFALTGIGVAILDLDGKILVATGWQDICKQFHRVHPETCKNCVESDTILSNGVPAGEFRLYRCKNNMWDISTPIIISGEKAGNLFLGQFFFEDEIPDIGIFRAQAEQYGFDEAAYLAAFERVPRWGRKKVNTVIRFYTEFARQISSLSFSNIQYRQTLKERNDYLRSLGESEEKFRLLFETINDAIFVHSIKADGTPGRFIEVNDAACQRLGYSRDEMLAMTPLDIGASRERSKAEEIRESLMKNGAVLFETVHVGKEGQRLPVESHVRLFDYRGRRAALSVSRDLSDREKAEEKLKESEERYRTLLQASMDGYLVCDLQGRFLETNDMYCAMSGYSRKQLLSMRISDLDGKENDSGVKTHIQRVMEDGWDRFESQHLHADGSFMDVEISAFYVDSQDQISIFIRDISERIRVEGDLRKSEKLLRNIIDSSADYIFVKDRHLRTIVCNKIFAGAVGKKPEDMIGKTDIENGWAREFVKGNPEKGIRGFEQDDLAALKGETVHVVDEPGNVTGDVHLFDTIKLPLLDEDGEIIGIMGVSRDITERKLMEENLRESEKRYRQLFQHLTAGFALHEIILDEQQRPVDYWFLEANPAFEELTGLPVNEIVGRTLLQVLPDSELYWIEKYGRVAMTGEPINFENYSGELDKYFNVTAYSPEPGRFATIFQDITERKKAEKELKKLAEAVSQASEGVSVTGTDGVIEYVNPAFGQITGYPEDEIIGEKPSLFKSGHQDTEFYKNMWETILSGSRWSGRIVNKRKDGSLYTGECSISPVKNEEGGIVNFVWITRDITKELVMEQRIAQSQKMEAIGALAGGIAHDFNNILFPIQGYSELLLDEMQEGTQEYESVQGIFTSARRAGELVNQILAFSRQSNPQRIPIRLQPILKEVIKLTRATIPTNIEMNSDISKDCGLVSADPIQIHQIAMNLITNAYHAVEESGGRISIELKSIDFDGDEYSADLFPNIYMESGSYARLTVSDTGVGIAPSVISRIFDPYFTTKPQGKGTGMGLAVVHGILKEYGGDIRVYSEKDVGSTFHVYLHLIENAVEKKDAFGVRQYQRGSERILIVDDEEPIMKMEKIMLERLGYDVTARTGSIEALEAFRARPGHFDLVITDMSMPNMTGVQLAQALFEIRKDIPMILCTGFSEKIGRKKAEAIGFSGYLMKPVVRSQLAETVRKVLDER